MDWACDVIPSALRDGGYCVTARRAHPVFASGVLLPWALGTTITWRGCRVASLVTLCETSQTLHKCRSTWTTQSRPCSGVALLLCRGGPQVLFLLQVVFRCSLLRVLRGRCAHTLLFTLARVPLEVRIIMCFLREVASLVFSLCPSLACRTVLDGAGYGTSHPTSTRCPSADVTSLLKTVVRTLKSRRVIAVPGRSRTPRRFQYAPRGDGHVCSRPLPSLPAESYMTDGSCKLPLCYVPLSCFSCSWCFLTGVSLDT